jgi:carbamoyl-phosphate synthase large subunit
MNILLTAIGKRVQLIKHLKKSFKVIGVDSGELVPASYFVDTFYRVPRYNDEGYIKRLIEICKSEKVNIIIPLYEKEFSLLNDYRTVFLQQGVILLLSSSEIINTFNSKLETYNYFVNHDIPTAVTYYREQIGRYLAGNSMLDVKYPLIIKPDDGMGSQNVFLVNSDTELKFFCEYVNNPVIQEFIEGIEYTVDVLCDLKGTVLSIVPRVRIETRSGEVTKTKTERNSLVISKVLDICSKTTFVGPITIQCIVKGSNISFIEINPRFGGGVPLAFECGVDYGKYIKMMAEGASIKPFIGEFDEKVMLRYDEAVIL